MVTEDIKPFDPLTDTGERLKAIKATVLEALREHDKEREHDTVELSRREIEELKTEIRALRNEQRFDFKQWIQKVLAYALGIMKSE